MRRSVLWFSVSTLLGVWSLQAAAQDAADSCVQQGLRPGSAAYHACLTASQEAMHGMFDPLKPEGSEGPGEMAGGEDMSTTDPDDPLIGLDPLGGDGGRDGGGSAGWDWSLRRR